MKKKNEMSQEDKAELDMAVLQIAKKAQGEERAIAVGNIAKETLSSVWEVHQSIQRLRSKGHDLFINGYSQAYFLVTWDEYKAQRDNYSRRSRSNRRMMQRLAERMKELKK